MTIINDTITFVNADFSWQANGFVSSAKRRLKSIEAQDPTVDAILAGLATADAPTLALAAPILASLDALLNP